MSINRIFVLVSIYLFLGYGCRNEKPIFYVSECKIEIMSPSQKIQGIHGCLNDYTEILNCELLLPLKTVNFCKIDSTYRKTHNNRFDEIEYLIVRTIENEDGAETENIFYISLSNKKSDSLYVAEVAEFDVVN